MSDYRLGLDIEALGAEYESTHAEMLQQYRAYVRAKQVCGSAGSALIAAMQESGLPSYGSMTSTLEWHAPSESHRPIYRHTDTRD